MKSQYYLLDTHALIFWNLKQGISQEFIQFLDYQDRLGNLFISAISFGEIALLIQRGKLALTDIYAWKEELFQNTNLQLINPTVDKMIEATRLPNHHKDPFDRLLIIQANYHHLLLVTKNSIIQGYAAQTFWM